MDLCHNKQHLAKSILGLQVGVYVGCCGSEIHAQWLANVNEITGYEQTGCTLSMFANRLSFSFDFQGPSKAVDTGLCMCEHMYRCYTVLSRPLSTTFSLTVQTISNCKVCH